MALVAAACGGREQIAGAPSGEEVAESTPATLGEGVVTEPVVLAVPDRVADAKADPTVAGEAITAFGYDLFAATRAEEAIPNLTVSPVSVAVAYGMLEPGTNDQAQNEVRSVFRITDPEAYHRSMSALEVDLETRVPVPVPDPSGSNPDDPGELTVRLANAAYLQQGYPFRADYLETIGTHYGPVLREVDFAPDPDAVARAINGFVAENTEDLITDLIGEGVLTIDTVLVLVNALYLDATWVRPFDEELTAAAPFTTADGTEVTVDLMVSVSDSVARGDGWIGATKAYSGGLEAQFVLPDEGKFNDVADSLDEVFATFDKPPDGQRVPDQLAAPRFEIRANLELDPALRSLGLEAVYQRGGLLGMANDGRLVLHKTIHETYVRLDESGTEAAAATAGTVRITSAGGPKPLPVMLDRPFLYRIVDTHSGATLFIGQVTDPTAC